MLRLPHIDKDCSSFGPKPLRLINEITIILFYLYLARLPNIDKDYSSFGPRPLRLINEITIILFYLCLDYHISTRTRVALGLDLLD